MLMANRDIKMGLSCRGYNVPSMCWLLLFKKWTKKQKVIGSPVGSFSSNVLDLDIEVVDVICNCSLRRIQRQLEQADEEQRRSKRIKACPVKQADT